MKRLDLLTKDDLLDECHFPVLLFNDLFEDRFLEILTECLAKGVGFGVDYGACTFANDLDDYDKKTGVSFEGIELATHSGDEILLDYDMFYYYLNLVCVRFSEGRPQHKETVDKALGDFRKIYLSPAYALDKLYQNRLLRNDEEFENFEQALKHLSHIEDCSIIPQICSCFDDDTKDEEVMFGLIHLVEAFDDECGLIALANALPSMLTKASNWAKTLLIRILNDERSSQIFKYIIAENENKITIEKLFEEIGR